MRPPAARPCLVMPCGLHLTSPPHRDVPCTDTARPPRRRNEQPRLSRRRGSDDRRGKGLSNPSNSLASPNDASSSSSAFQETRESQPAASCTGSVEGERRLALQEEVVPLDGGSDEAGGDDATEVGGWWGSGGSGGHVRHFLVCGGDGYVFAHGRNVQVKCTCGGAPYFSAWLCVGPP